MLQNWKKPHHSPLSKSNPLTERPLCPAQQGRGWETYSDGAGLGSHPWWAFLPHAPLVSSLQCASFPVSRSTRTGHPWVCSLTFEAPKVKEAGLGGGGEEAGRRDLVKAASGPGVSTEAKRAALAGLAVYLRHSGEVELGTGLFLFHTFPPNPFQRGLWNPSDKFPRGQKNPWFLSTQPFL